MLSQKPFFFSSEIKIDGDRSLVIRGMGMLKGNVQNVSYRILQCKRYQIQPSNKIPYQLNPSRHTHIDTHSMNKSHTLVGLSCSSLFSLLSPAAASPSSLQTLWIQQQHFSICLQMLWVEIGVSFNPNWQDMWKGVNKHRKKIPLDIFNAGICVSWW